MLRRIPAAVLAVLAALPLTALLYGRAVSGFFIFDDFAWLECAADTLASWHHIFTLHISNFFRPVCHVLFASIEGLFGPAPIPYHVVALVLHVTCAALLANLVRRLVGEHRIALLTALLFLLLPVHAEALLWISAISEPLSIAVLLVGLTAWHRFLTSSRGRAASYAVTLLALVVALAAKESTTVMVPLMALVHWSTRARALAPLPRSPLACYLLPVLVLAAYLVAQWHWQRDAFLIAEGHYRLGAGALRLLARAVWRLLDHAWPPFALALVGSLSRPRGTGSIRRLPTAARAVAPAIIALVVALLPYLFFRRLELAGRYLYLAAAITALLGALALGALLRAGLRRDRLLAALAVAALAAQALTVAPDAVDRYLTAAAQSQRFIRAATRDLPASAQPTLLLDSLLVGQHLTAAMRVFHPGHQANFRAVTRTELRANGPRGRVYRYDPSTGFQPRQ